MNGYNDYFTPRVPVTLCNFLFSNRNHKWSSSPNGPFVTPIYDSSNLDGFGGGTFPAGTLKPGDNRTRVPSWGGGGSYMVGGCCSDGATVTPLTYRQPFSMFLYTNDNKMRSDQTDLYGGISGPANASGFPGASGVAYSISATGVRSMRVDNLPALLRARPPESTRHTAVPTGLITILSGLTQLRITTVDVLEMYRGAPRQLA
jgi:hypothetical protein